MRFGDTLTDISHALPHRRTRRRRNLMIHNFARLVHEPTLNLQLRLLLRLRLRILLLQFDRRSLVHFVFFDHSHVYELLHRWRGRSLTRGRKTLLRRQLYSSPPPVVVVIYTVILFHEAAAHTTIIPSAVRWLALLSRSSAWRSWTGGVGLRGSVLRVCSPRTFLPQDRPHSSVA